MLSRGRNRVFNKKLGFKIELTMEDSRWGLSGRNNI